MKLVPRPYSILVCLFLPTILHSPAFSSTKNLSSKILTLIDFNEVYVPNTKRLAMANAVLSYWLDFDGRVPRLSPSEREWLTEELSQTSVERITHAINTTQYSLWKMELHLEVCLNAIKGLVDSIENSPVTEMFYWLKTINCYTESNIQYYLKNANLSDGKADGAFFTAANEMILHSIVNRFAPSAMAETMGWDYGKNKK